MTKNTESNTIKVKQFELWEKDIHINEQFHKSGIEGISHIFKKRGTQAYIKFDNVKYKNIAKEKIPSLLNRKGKNYKIYEAKDVNKNIYRRKNKKENIKKPLPILKAIDVVTPLYLMSYEKQLEFKIKTCKKAIQKIKTTLKKDCSNYTFPWNSKSLYNLERIIESPVINEYRNKDTHTFGHNRNGKVTLGYQIGRYKESGIIIESPVECKHIPQIFIEISSEIEKFISEYKDVKVYDPTNKTGTWRRISYRTGKFGRELTINIQISDKEINKEKIKFIKKKITIYLTNFIENKNIKLICILFTIYNGISNFIPLDTPYDILWGSSCVLFEEINDLIFEISPNSFFQVNTYQAENLYKLIKNLLNCDKESIIFDICCGTGTIGLTLANSCKKVIGLEIVEEAISDAIRNSEINNIDNAYWYVGKAEETFKVACEEHLKGREMVYGVVDPPRSGLHKSILKAIRKSPIKDMIYVSCNPNSCANDIAFLVKPENSKRKGRAFKPIKTIGMDMFPHTEHCELITLLSRCCDLEVPMAKGKEGKK